MHVHGYKVRPPFSLANSSEKYAPYRRLFRSMCLMFRCNMIATGGFNPSVGVCELNPQYGKLLLETTSHPLKEELFEEGDCFISGLEGDFWNCVCVVKLPVCYSVSIEASLAQKGVESGSTTPVQCH